jgi:YgiT-type zinc finger domain-containing protein
MGTRVPAEATWVKCVICKHGETHPGTATVTFTRDGATVVIKGVPARVCGNCGEEYVDEATAGRLLRTAEEASRAGVQVDIREYLAA